MGLDDLLLAAWMACRRSDWPLCAALLRQALEMVESPGLRVVEDEANPGEPGMPLAPLLVYAAVSYWSETRDRVGLRVRLLDALECAQGEIGGQGQANDA